MHYIKLLNYNTELLFISMSVTCRVVFVSSWCFIICFIVLSIFRRVTNGLTLRPKDHITLHSLQNEQWSAFICHHHICLVTTLMNRKLTKGPLTHSYKTPGVSSILIVINYILRMNMSQILDRNPFKTATMLNYYCLYLKSSSKIMLNGIDRHQRRT